VRSCSCLWGVCAWSREGRLDISSSTIGIEPWSAHLDPDPNGTDRTPGWRRSLVGVSTIPESLRSASCRIRRRAATSHHVDRILMRPPDDRVGCGKAVAAAPTAPSTTANEVNTVWRGRSYRSAPAAPPNRSAAADPDALDATTACRRNRRARRHHPPMSAAAPVRSGRRARQPAATGVQTRWSPRTNSRPDLDPCHSVGLAATVRPPLRTRSHTGRGQRRRRVVALLGHKLPTRSRTATITIDRSR